MQNKHLPQSIPLANNISKNKTKKKRVKYNADFSLLIFCARIFRRVDFRNFPGHSKHDSAAEKFILMRWIIQRNFCDSFHCKLHFGPVKKPELLCWLFRKLLINGGQGSGRAVLLEGGGRVVFHSVPISQLLSYAKDTRLAAATAAAARLVHN